MSIAKRITGVNFLVSALTVLAAQLLPVPQSDAQTIPLDAAARCPVAATTFAGWFQTGIPSLNGVVNPANSVTFPNSPNCSFYAWSMQMFLWLTSPTPIEYGGGGGRIFDSKPFFEVSPPDASGNRHFVAHNPALFNPFTLNAGFLGPHGLPVIFSKTHQMLEVERAPIGPTGRPLVRNRLGVAVEISDLQKGPDGRAIFLGKSGAKLPQATAMHRFSTLPAQIGRALVVQKFVIGGRPIFVDALGNVIDVEQGEAEDNAVLMSQQGSLVYYGIAVNDVYAYFLTAIRDGAIAAGTLFPTSAGDLAQITAFASGHGGVTFPDPNALAIVVKTAWVEASSLPNPGDYVTMQATVPAYVPDPSDPTHKWLANGHKTVSLALVGMHVVGSAAGHPEMIWATFEHLGNTPNEAYSYLNAGNAKIPVSRNTAGTWLFSASGATDPFNVKRMTVDTQSGNILATAGNTIGPSNTLRSKPWGGAIDQAPNPIADTATSSSEIISIDNSVRGMMPAGDVRGNYILTGATWTIGGAPPGGNFPNGNVVGTSQMEDSVLETYFQGTSLFASGGLNCFDCHSPSLDPNVTDNLSHVFSRLSALSLPGMAINVVVLQRSVNLHRIRVTIKDSLSGIPVQGASVAITNSETGATVGRGQTANDGTVTVQYAPCRTIIFGPPFLPVGRPPIGRPIAVPCDGAATSTHYPDGSFDAP